MATEANSSVRTEDSVTPSNPNNQKGKSNRSYYYKPPEISKKTERELQESTERFMKSHAQQSNGGIQYDNASSPNPNSNPNSNGEYGSAQPVKHKDESVDAEPAHDTTQSGEQKNSGTS